MKYSIRLSTTDDLQGILNLNVKEYWSDIQKWKKASQRARHDIGGWWADIKLLEWYFNVLKLGNGGIAIAEINNQIIGELDYVVGYDSFSNYKGIRGHIIWLLVDKEWRQSGIATALINFVKNLIQVPFWVEAEDQRTTNLYSKLGKVNHYLDTWEMDLPSTDINKPVKFNMKETDFKSSLELLQKDWELRIGRYYAYAYDFQMLQQSEPVYEYVWGNTSGIEFVKILINQTEVYALLTQYPRIFTKKDLSFDDLRDLIVVVLELLLERNFDNVVFQTLHDSETQDPVYEI